MDSVDLCNVNDSTISSTRGTRCAPTHLGADISSEHNAVNCAYSYFNTTCSPCMGTNGTFNKQCNVKIAPANGGTACPAGCAQTVGVTNVTTYNCTSSVWTPWSVWSSCTATCGYGYQSRFTGCNDTSQEWQYQTCNTNNCPSELLFH
jgi:hypothetical protein